MESGPPAGGALAPRSLVWHVAWPALLPLQPAVLQLSALDGPGAAERARRLEAILQLELWFVSALVSLGVSAATALFIRYRAGLRGTPGQKLIWEVASSSLLFLSYLISRFAVELGALAVSGIFFLGAGRMEPGPLPLYMPCVAGLFTALSIALERRSYG